MEFIKWLFGKKEDISSKTMEHSIIGNFNKRNRLVSGGHSQKNIDELRRRGIVYNINKTYSNGVRVGNIPNHIDKYKKTGNNQSWFPENRRDTTIKNAGQIVARGAKKSDGIIKSGHYGNINVGIIRTKGKIGTIFPMSIQKNKKGVEIYERKKTTRTSRKKYKS